MRKYITLFALVTAFVFVFGANFAMAADKVINWKMQCAYPPGDNSYDIHSMELVKLVDELSKGKVKIELYQPGALCDFKEMQRAIQHGMMEVACLFGSYYVGTVPVGDVVSGLPFAWGHGEKGMEECVEIFFGEKYRLIDVIREAYAKKNAFFLTPCWCDAYPFLFNFPMHTIGDLKGRKIRAGGAVAKWFTSVGAATVTIPGAEIYMAMKLGTIEGTPFPPAILETQKLKEVIKYIVLPGIGGPNTQHIINMKAWEGLPEDIRKALNDEKVLIDFYRKNGKRYVKADEVAMKSASEYGVKTITLSADVMKEERTIAQPIWDEIAAKDEYCARAVEIVRRYHRDKGGL